MSEQSRKQFEAWYLAEYYEGDKQCGLEWLSTEACGGYRYAEPSMAWKVWQASRQAIEVELPSSDRIHTEDMAYYHADVCSSIESCGLRVKA